MEARCKKATFRTKEYAIEETGRIKIKKGDLYKPLRPYLCPKCTNWHLTSNPESQEIFDLKIKIKELESKIQELDPVWQKSEKAIFSRKINALLLENNELKSEINTLRTNH